MLALTDLHCAIHEMPILNGISLRIDAGEMVGIIGPNGSGKTTLFNCISGFSPVTRGGISFKGSGIENWSPSRRAQEGVGRIFQNFGIFREMSVVDNIVIALEGRQPVWKTLIPRTGLAAANREKALEVLDGVGLLSRAELKAGSLSGGQMRLLEIARTLAFGAELFLLDEPTAGVSPRMKEDVAALIIKLRELGKTVVIIEHDINFIQKFCARIVVLDSGRVVLDDTPDRVRANPMLQEIYFGKGDPAR